MDCFTAKKKRKRKHNSKSRENSSSSSSSSRSRSPVRGIQECNCHITTAEHVKFFINTDYQEIYSPVFTVFKLSTFMLSDVQEVKSNKLYKAHLISCQSANIHCMFCLMSELKVTIVIIIVYLYFCLVAAAVASSLLRS